MVVLTNHARAHLAERFKNVLNLDETFVLRKVENVLPQVPTGDVETWVKIGTFQQKVVLSSESTAGLKVFGDTLWAVVFRKSAWQNARVVTVVLRRSDQPKDKSKVYLG
jgi:hypothetical protein